MAMLTAVAVVISAIAFYFCTGFNHVWWAAWIAPVPVLALAYHGKGQAARLAPFTAYLLGIIHIAPYIKLFNGWAVAIAFCVLMALAFQACVAFARRCFLKLPPLLAVWGFPVAWTCYEFLFAVLGPYGTVLNYSYSQLDFPPALQIASVTGIWGITFTIMLWCSVWAMWNRKAARVFLLITIILAFASGRLDQREGPPTKVGLITDDADLARSWRTEDPQQAVAIAKKWATLVAAAAGQGARVIVLPEKFLGITPADQQQIYSVFKQAARVTRTRVVAGFNFIDIQPPRNIAAIFLPNGAAPLVYDKHHMLPGPETPYKPGNQLQLFNASPGNWGVEICKDMDYPGWSRRYGQLNIPFMAVPAWDFVVDGYFHGRMAQMRGVEDGFTVVHDAQQGLLYISDAYGRIIAQRTSGSASPTVLVHDAPAGLGRTFYARYGDWFGWLNVAGLVGLTVAAARRKKRTSV